MGHPGPIHLAKWTDGSTIDLLSLANHPFRLRFRWFTKILKDCLRHVGQPIVAKYGLPASQVLNFHTGTIAAPWPSWQLSFIDSWIWSHPRDSRTFQYPCADFSSKAGNIRDPMLKGRERWEKMVVSNGVWFPPFGQNFHLLSCFQQISGRPFLSADGALWYGWTLTPRH